MQVTDNTNTLVSRKKGVKRIASILFKFPVLLNRRGIHRAEGKRYNNPVWSRVNYTKLRTSVFLRHQITTDIVFKK